VEERREIRYLPSYKNVDITPKASPLDYDWPVNGCDILMIETSHFSQEYIESFVQLLFSFGADKVTYLSTEMLSTIFKKEF
jgi:hypothetical protein